MPWLLSSGAEGGSFGYSGELWRYRPTAGVLAQRQQLPLPTGVNTVDAPGSHVVFGNRCYITGRFTSNLVVDEHFRSHVQGIRPPTAPTTIATGSATGITGDVVGYLTFWDEKTGERSGLSGASASVSFSDQKVSWTGIPTTSPDPRVSHVEFWRSVDGGAIRLVTRRQLGVTSLTEAVATLALGEAFGTTFTRMPRGTINATYNLRQAIAGNALAPDTLYVSKINFFERYEGLSFKTDHGEPIVGLAEARDLLIAFTPTSMYALRGYTEDDMAFKLIEEEIGALSHACLRVIRDNIWFCNDQGFFMWNGAVHQMNLANRKLWTDFYAANRAECERGFAVHSRLDKTYRFYVAPQDTSAIDTSAILFPDPLEAGIGSLAWVFDYYQVGPEAGGAFSQPDLSFDLKTRTVAWATELGLPGTKRFDTYLGLCDGKIYVEDEDDPDDDGDDYQKMLWIAPGASFVGAPGEAEKYRGKKIDVCWIYAQSEDDGWRAYVMAGDESIVSDPALLDDERYSGIWHADQDASMLASPDFEACAKTTHTLGPNRVSGHAIAAVFRWLTPSKTVRWSGWGGKLQPGEAGRPPATEVEPEM